jgi:hypothetical protein
MAETETKEAPQVAGTKILRNGSRRTFTLGKEPGQSGKWTHWNPGEVRSFPVSVINPETKEHLKNQEADFFLNYYGVVDTALESKDSKQVAQTIDDLKKKLADAEAARDAAQLENASLKADTDGKKNLGRK